MKKKSFLITLSLAAIALLVPLFSKNNQTSVQNASATSSETTMPVTSSSDYWDSYSNASFSGTTMDATTTAFTWVSKTFKSASHFEYVVDSKLGIDGASNWRYETIVLTTSTTPTVSSGKATSANTIAFDWGWSPGFYLSEADSTGTSVFGGRLYNTDDSGKILVSGTNVTSSYVGNAHFNVSNTITTLIGDIVVGESSVTINFELIAHPWSSTNTMDWTWSYTTTNVDMFTTDSLRFGFIRSGNSGQIDNDTKTFKTSLSVTGKLVSSLPVDYSTNSANWSTLSGFNIDDGHMYCSGSYTSTNAVAYTNQVGGNSTAKFVLDYTSVNEGTGGFAIMLKGTAEDYAKAKWNYGSSGEYTATCTGGNWAALVVNSAKAFFVSCKDGTFTIENANFYFSGYDCWYVLKQVNTVTLTTTDTDTGIQVKVTFLASGHDKNTGNTYSKTVNIANTALWGVQSYGLVTVRCGTAMTSANNTINAYITDTTGGSDKDYGTVKLFNTLYMHTDVTTSEAGTGLCVSENWYSDAKAALGRLTTAQRVLFATNADFADLYARLQAWAIANGETISVNTTTGDVSYAKGNALSSINQSNINEVIIIGIVLASILALSIVIVLKKKKHN